jgi:hypothetical protein
LIGSLRGRLTTGSFSFAGLDVVVEVDAEAVVADVVWPALAWDLGALEELEPPQPARLSATKSTA